MSKQNQDGQPFLSDVQTLRAKARENIDKGAVTPAYDASIQQTIDILQARAGYGDCLRPSLHDERRGRAGNQLREREG